MSNSIIQEASLSAHMNPKESISGIMNVPKVYHEGTSTPATKDRLGSIIVGDNLSVTEDGVLSVDVANAVEADNTKPITSAAVNTLVGNIDSLLSII